MQAVLVGLRQKALKMGHVSVARFLLREDFFSLSALGREEVAHGYKGKGVTSHSINNANGHPIDATATAANNDERKQVYPFLKKLKSWPLQGAILEADRGYTSSRLSKQIIHRGIYPAIGQWPKIQAYS